MCLQFFLRYPEDKYDRTWYAYGTEAPKRVINTTQDISLGASRDQAPVAVLQSAQYWLKSETFTFSFNVTGSSSYMVYMWFAEIDPQAKNKTRKFQVGVDNNMQAPINIANLTGGLYTAYEYGYTSVNLTTTSTMTFAATADSDLGPILNAIEVNLLSDPVPLRTDAYGPDGITLHLNDLTSASNSRCHPQQYLIIYEEEEDCAEVPHHWKDDCMYNYNKNN